MSYELWLGNDLLGRSSLDFHQVSPVTFAGSFEALPGMEDRLERLAIACHPMSAWMNRDVVDENGRYAVLPSFRNSRLFDAISETVRTSRNPSLRLHRTDGTVIRTSQLVLQDMGAMTLHAELVEEAMRAADEEEPAPPPFNVPGGPELLKQLKEEALEEEMADAWRGDMHPDDCDLDDPLFEQSLERRTNARFNLHVMIERTGDIPANNLVPW